MACCGLGSKEVSYVRGSCAVCIEIDKDDSEKDVFFCQTCNAYICKTHKKEYGDRIKAAVKVKGRKIINLFKI